MANHIKQFTQKKLINPNTNMKKTILNFLVIMSFSNCTNKKKELENLICKDSIQYWNVEWPRERADFYGFTYSFDKNGNVKKYSFDKVDNSRSLFEDYSVKTNLKWSVTSDSILRIMEFDEKIKRYTTDSIFTESKYSDGTKSKSIYIRVKGKLNIE